jgi:hypothetical protein
MENGSVWGAPTGPLERKMYDCERCGTSFSPIRIASPEACPRCLAREGVRSPLTYSLFGDLPRSRKAGEATRPGVPGAGSGRDPGDAPSATA